MKFNKKIRGFTLVELLIVCGIIAILSAVIIPGIFQTRARGRDSEVRAQVQTIKLALARAAQADNSGKYPGTPGTWYCLQSTAGTCGASLNANADPATLNPLIIPYFPGREFPQAQGAVSGQYRYNAYVYNPYDSGVGAKISGYSGPVLLWWQEKVIKAYDCNGTLAGALDSGVYYCYEKLIQ